MTSGLERSVSKLCWQFCCNSNNLSLWCVVVVVNDRWWRDGKWQRHKHHHFRATTDSRSWSFEMKKWPMQNCKKFCCPFFFLFHFIWCSFAWFNFCRVGWVGWVGWGYFFCFSLIPPHLTVLFRLSCCLVRIAFQPSLIHHDSDLVRFVVFGTINRQHINAIQCK